MAWSDDPEGSDLNNAYEYLVDAYSNKLPENQQSLAALANRPISG